MAFGINKVIYTNRKENSEAHKLNFELVEFEELLKKSDFLICCASLNKENENKFDLELAEKHRQVLVGAFSTSFSFFLPYFDSPGRNFPFLISSPQET